MDAVDQVAGRAPPPDPDRRSSTGSSPRCARSMPPPLHHGRAVRIHYLTQGGARPPTFLLWATTAGRPGAAYRRFIANQLRERYGFRGTPLRIVVKAKTIQKTQAGSATASRPATATSRGSASSAGLVLAAAAARAAVESIVHLPRHRRSSPPALSVEAPARHVRVLLAAHVEVRRGRHLDALVGDDLQLALRRHQHDVALLGRDRELLVVRLEDDLALAAAVRDRDRVLRRRRARSSRPSSTPSFACRACRTTSGGLSLPFHSAPTTSGRLMSPCSNATSTSSLTSGMKNQPRSLPAPSDTIGTHHVVSWADSVGIFTFTRSSLLGSLLSVTMPITGS